jgi:hypothetical protein
VIQIQVVIEYFQRPGDEKPTIRLTVNKFEREDANDEEREMAVGIEQLHAGIMEMIAKEQDGTFEEIEGTVRL